MYDIVKIGDNQKVIAPDLNRMGSLTREAMGAQSRQMLVTGFKFAEFSVTFANGSFVANVSQGFLWKEGLPYRSLAATPLDLVADTPPSDGLKRIISIVGFTVPARDDAPEEREFSVVVTPATSTAPAIRQNEPRIAATLNRLVAQVAKRVGDFAPEPKPPSLAPDLLEIARVTLTRSGIERIDFVEDNRAPNLEAVAEDVEDLVDFVEGQGRRLDTIDKNLAALSASIPKPVAEALLQQFSRNLAEINEQVKVKTTDLSYRVDYALDERYTDNTYVGYAAAVEDGIRFPWVASKEQPLGLFTPGDPGTKIISNLLLPDFVEEARLVVSGMDVSLSISSQVNTVTTATKVEIPRTAVKHGTITVCSNSKEYATGYYDVANKLFTRANGETLNVISVRKDAPNHFWLRLDKTWIDSWIETRWDKITTQIGLNGTKRGQTFRVPDFGYIPSIELAFTAADAAFGVTVLLCEASVVGPDLNRVLEKCDLAPGVVKADAKGTVFTKFAFRPAFCDPGKLYCWVTVTKGNFSLAAVKGNKFAGGSSWLSTDDSFFAGDTDVDYAMKVNFCRFKSTRTEIRLNDVDNVNGDIISALKFLYGSVVPAGTRILHLARRSGGNWLPIAEVTQEKPTTQVGVGAGPFATAPLPASVQQMVVFLGSTTLMPAIDLSQAWVTALKLGNVRDWFSIPLNFGTNCNRAEVEVIVDPFDPANHTTGCKLIVAGAAVTPASVPPPVDDPKSPGRRTCLYNFTFPTSSTARLELPGTLASILSSYHVERWFVRAWLV